MKHIDERTLELFVRGSGLVKQERREIKRHLSVCEWCSSLHVELVSYYREVNRLQSKQEQHAAHALSVPERTLQTMRANDAAPIMPVPQTIPRRIIDSWKQYPVRWSVGFAAVMTLALLIGPRIPTLSPNPLLVRSEKGFLSAYDDQGERLWKKYIGLGIDDAFRPDYMSGDHLFGMSVVDVDGDGRREVFGVFGWANWTEQHSPWLRTVASFHADGSERWRYALHRQISIQGKPFSDDYRFYQLLAGDFTHTGRPDVVACAAHIPWFPSVVLRLDGRTGELQGEYWHNGQLPLIDRYDIDGDGVDELFFGGQNNRFQQACVAVLDPREIQGQAPAPPEFVIDGIPQANEKAYFVLPASDLKPYWSDITNVVTQLSWKADSTLEVVVSENITYMHTDTTTRVMLETGTIYFYFDRTMRCVQVRVSDSFSGIRAKYRMLGLVQGDIDAGYLDRLARGVRYWDGKKFVTGPILNGREVPLP